LAASTSGALAHHPFVIFDTEHPIDQPAAGFETFQPDRRNEEASLPSVQVARVLCVSEAAEAFSACRRSDVPEPIFWPTAPMPTASEPFEM
jgi:hypothetical protein